MKKKRKYIYLEKCLIICILQIYIFSFYDFLFFISLSDAKSIEYFFQYFIRRDSTANKFGKKKEAFTYKLIRQILEKTHEMFILHWVEVNILLEIFQQRKKSSPSCFMDEVYK